MVHVSVVCVMIQGNLLSNSQNTVNYLAMGPPMTSCFYCQTVEHMCSSPSAKKAEFHYYLCSTAVDNDNCTILLCMLMMFFSMISLLSWK